MHAIYGGDGMKVEELKDILKNKHITDDTEIILRNNVGAPPITEPDFFVTTSERGLRMEIMPGRKIG